jgi:glycosyltransferase involved in cell wall biosynthesis
MIPIIIPTYNRPHYFKETLDALFQCQDLDKFYIETFEENESYHQEMNTHLLEPYQNKIKIVRNLHKERKGCAPNILEAIQEIIKKHEYFVVVEDDIVLSEDALTLALWAFPHLTDERPAITFHCKKYELKEFPKDEHKKVQQSYFWHPWGWAGKSSFFRDFLTKYDWNINKEKGWDMPINIYAHKYDIKFLQPLIGRSKNIGAIGNCQRSPQEHKQYCLNEFYYRGEPVNDFQLIGGNLEERQNHYYPGGKVYEEYKKYFKGGVL